MSPELQQTLRLEEALKLLATNSRIYSVPSLGRMFRLKDGELWEWLKTYNGGDTDITESKIAAVKARLNGCATIGTRPARDPKQPIPAVNMHLLRKAGIIKRAMDAEEADETSDSSAPPPVSVHARIAAPVQTPPASLPTRAVQAPQTELTWLQANGVEVASTVICYIAKITPAIAQRLLEAHNVENRIPSSAKINRFANSIRDQRWMINGETIKFSVSGRLLDGQSRLKAIVRSGKAADLEIRLGLPENAQETMDVGELRKSSHMLQMKKELYPSVLAPALKYLWLLDRGNGRFDMKGRRAGFFENFNVKPCLERHAGIRDSVRTVFGKKEISRIMPYSMAAFVHYVFGRIDEAQRERFWTGLFTETKADDAIAKLRNVSLLSKQQGWSPLFTRATLGLSIRVWNAMRSGGDVNWEFPVGTQFEAIDGWKVAA